MKFAWVIRYQPWLPFPYKVFLDGPGVRISDPPIASFETQEEAHQYAKQRLEGRDLARYEFGDDIKGL